MAVIESNTGVITQINVFTVQPGNLEPLVETLKEAAHAVAHVEGWISISLHVALDGTQVTNYAQCADQQSWDAVMEILFSNGFIERITALAEPHPCLYQVVWTLNRDRVA